MTNTTTYLYELGFSVIPMHVKDGRKVPALAAGFKDVLPIPLATSLSVPNPPLYGVLCGQHSGNFMCLDFDLKNAHGVDVFAEFMQALQEVDEALHKKVSTCMARTMSGGYHIYYRTLSPKKGKAYASVEQESKKFQPIIETRGDGQIAVLPPSEGYAFLDPSMSFAKVPRLTDNEEQVLLALSMLYDEKPVVEYKAPTKRSAETDSVFDQWSEKQDFHSILTQDGYHLVRQTGVFSHYSRPNAKHKSGIDATLIDGKYFYPFSTSISEFPESEKAYSLYRYWGFTRYPYLSDDERWKTMAKELAPYSAKPQPAPAPQPTTKSDKLFRNALNNYRGDTDIAKESYIKMMATSEHIPIEEARSIVQEVIRLHGDEKGEDILKGEAKVADYIKKNFRIVYNTVKQRITVVDKEGNETNWNKNTIYNKVSEAGIRASVNQINAIWNDPEKHEDFNPLKKYFESLPKRTANSQTMDDLMRFLTFDSKVDKKFAASMFRKHFVRAIKQVYIEGYANRYCPVLVSRKEKVGKSLLIDFLNPMGMEFIADVRGKDKDELVKIVENFFINLDEIDNITSSKTLNAWLKNFISLQYAQIRKTYREDNKGMKRNASIWGTSNHPFLDAENENTRFIVMPIESIDWRGYSTLIKIDDLWSEAYEAYSNEESGEITHEEEAEQYYLQEEWMVHKDAYHIVKAYVAESTTETSAIQLINDLDYYQVTGRKPVDVGGLERALAKQGFRFKIKSGMKLWYACVDTEKRRKAALFGAAVENSQF